MRHPNSNARQPILATSCAARDAMDIAGAALGVSIAEIAARGRSRAQVAHARQIAMYLAHVVGQMSLTEISIAFGRDRTTVAHACHSIEDRRNGDLFDRQVEALETEMRARILEFRIRRRLRARRVEPAPIPPVRTTSRRAASRQPLRKPPRQLARQTSSETPDSPARAGRRGRAVRRARRPRSR